MNSINEILNFNHPALFERYNKTYPDNKLSAQEAVNEVIKYLWLTQKHQLDKLNFPDNKELDFICSMYPEMCEIDDMWHTFLLFTKDYTDFCIKHFGQYIHHTPKTNEEPYNIQYFEIEFTRYLSYVYDNLGEETVKKWFADWLD